MSEVSEVSEVWNTVLYTVWTIDQRLSMSEVLKVVFVVSRLANSQASALNAGVPTAPYSPESNCSYLADIWSVKELYSLWTSSTVIKKTGFGMTDQVISM